MDSETRLGGGARPARTTACFAASHLPSLHGRRGTATCTSGFLQLACPGRGSPCRRTAFTGSRLTRAAIAARGRNARARARGTKMLVDPWSVSAEAVDAIATQLFAASLFPYLGFLYFLGREEVGCPKLAKFGFQFLLVFVFATIPAGIYAKVHYHDILANVDWLHGAAESLLTVTNFLIVLGFRNAITGRGEEKTVDEAEGAGEKQVQLKSAAGAGVLAAAGAGLGAGALGLGLHAEPGNALSFPTWVIHISSLVEWLVAMGLVWQYAETSGKERWKGLTWGMLPLHTSGICACTYHFFYNAAGLNGLVALQAGLTCGGNATMAAAAWRLWRGGRRGAEAGGGREEDGAGLVGFEDMGARFARDSNARFFYKVAAVSCVGAAAVKWGGLWVDAAFAPSAGVALAMVAVPTGLNMAKWAVRSRGASDFGGFL